LRPTVGRDRTVRRRYCAGTRPPRRPRPVLGRHRSTWSRGGSGNPLPRTGLAGHGRRRPPLLKSVVALANPSVGEGYDGSRSSSADPNSPSARPVLENSVGAPVHADKGRHYRQRALPDQMRDTERRCRDQTQCRGRSEKGRPWSPEPLVAPGRGRRRFSQLCHPDNSIHPFNVHLPIRNVDFRSVGVAVLVVVFVLAPDRTVGEANNRIAVPGP
jgi:hypothetical protein